MTDRDAIATAAMPIFLAHALGIVDGYAPAIVARQAYQLADAMLTERTRAKVAEARPTPGGLCVNGYRAHRWNPITLTCFRCGTPAHATARGRAKDLLSGMTRKVVNFRD